MVMGSFRIRTDPHASKLSRPVGAAGPAIAYQVVLEMP